MIAEQLMPNLNCQLIENRAGIYVYSNSIRVSTRMIMIDSVINQYNGSVELQPTELPSNEFNIDNSTFDEEIALG